MTSDDKDKREARSILLAIVVVLALAAIAFFLLLPMLGGITGGIFAPGLGLKESAIIAFFVTVVLLVIFTLAAGDGLLGELQFILAGFFTFFIVIWLMIAWIF
ncbi:MAG TPA: hypothetical protein VIC08_12495 [Cellvibrionaceae bacterium]